MTVGKQHPDLARFWLHSEPAQFPHGHRFWLRFGRLTFHAEWEGVSRREWGIYFSLVRNGFDWLRINIGPGCIPF